MGKKQGGGVESFRDRIVGFRRVPANQLVVDKLNPIAHGGKQKSALLAALRSVGVVDAVIVRERDDGKLVLIDGELRRGVLKTQPIPCLVTDLNAAEAALALATMRAIGDLADYDAEAFAALLDELPEDVDATLNEMLREVAEAEGLELEAADDDDKPTGKKKRGGRRAVNLSYTPAEIAEFNRCEKELRRKHDTTTEAATVLAVMRADYGRALAARKHKRGSKSK